MPKIKIVILCSKCGKEPKRDKEKSNKNWDTIPNKPCEYCGAKLKIKVVQ